MSHLLHDPHHDGSIRYVSDDSPRLGRSVTLLCRTSTAMPVTGVWVRSVQDGEPQFDEAVVDCEAEHEVWWRARVRMRNPVQRYRFLIATGDTYVWLTGSGVSTHDVPDAHDFVLSSYPPAPDWGRDAVVYQIFPDRFARSAAADGRELPAWARPAAWDDRVVFKGPHTPRQFFGGDLDGVTEHLDHIAGVGANTVYLTPFFPSGSNHRYDASSFEQVDPLLGGDEALHRLVSAVHRRGWRILGDLTTNHTGNLHEWFQTALAKPDSPERGYYYFHPGMSRYEGWLGARSLPKLDHTSDAMRARLVEGPDSIVARWLKAPHHLDGWRVDVANMTGRHADVDLAQTIARLVRQTSVQTRKDALVLAEHGHDASDDLAGDGWHGTMNYVGFTRPVWSWLRARSLDLPFLGMPVPVPRRAGLDLVATMRAFQGRFGWRSFDSSWNILGSHDTARIRTVTGDGELHRVAAGLQFTLPGVPMVFAGDEIGLQGVLGEDSRRTMPWHRRETWDHETMAVYAALAGLRRDQPALRRGGLRWVHVSANAIAYVREHPSGNVLVAASRGRARDISLPAGALGLTDGTTLFSTGGVGGLRRSGRGRDATVELPLSRAGFAAYAL